MNESTHSSAMVQHEDPLTISALWSMCEHSESSVKLLLPDDLTVAYYLPQPKNSQVRTKTKEVQLLRRLDIQYSNYVKSKLKRHGGLKSDVLIDSALLQPLTEREKDIESRLLQPYRQDDFKKQLLFREVFARLVGATELAPELKITPRMLSMALRDASPRNIKPRDRLSVGRLAADVRGRQVAALQRHGRVLQQDEELMLERVERCREREAHVEGNIQAYYPPAAQSRAKQWLRYLKLSLAAQRLFQAVSVSRKLRALDPRKWEAVVAIQRVYRRWKLRSLIGPSAYNQLQRSMGGHRQSMISADFRTHGIVAMRRDACAMITSFLRGLTSLTRVLIRKYLMKVKVLQRLIKDYVQTTSKRVLLLRHLIDACVPVLQVHMEIVVGGRGLDLTNNTMTSADRSRLHLFEDTIRKHKVLSRMSTPGFHGYLRQLQSHLPEVMEVLAANRLYLNMLHSHRHHDQGTNYSSSYHDQGKDSEAHNGKDREAHQLEHLRQFIVIIEASKRRELLELYVKKKQQYMFQQRVVAPMKYASIPVFGISDAKTFIRGEGMDPLSKHLMEEKQREDELFAEKQFSTGHRKENMLRKGLKMASITLAKRSDQSHRSTACFLLMQSLNELDLLDCIVAFSLKAVKARSVLIASSRSSSDAKMQARSISVGSPLFGRQLVPSETLPDKPLYISSPSRPSVIPSSRRGTSLSPRSIVGLKSSSQLQSSGIRSSNMSHHVLVGRRHDSFIQHTAPVTEKHYSSINRSHHVSVGRRHDSFIQSIAPVTEKHYNSTRGTFTASSYVVGNR